MKYLKITILILLALAAQFAKAQYSTESDDKLLRFGFLLGFNSMDFDIENSMQNINGKVYRAEVSDLRPGFSVGIITDLRINRYFSLRTTPTLHFAERELVYKDLGGTEQFSTVIGSVPLSIPLYLKYSAERYGQMRPYLLFGGGSHIDIGRDNTLPVLLKPIDFFIEFGVGCDIYFSFFKLAPELKFALGQRNLLTSIADRNLQANEVDRKYTDALSRLGSRLITLSFNFE
jgi:hypothetical protein